MLVVKHEVTYLGQTGIGATNSDSDQEDEFESVAEAAADAVAEVAAEAGPRRDHSCGHEEESSV